jgi:hypothetical protein
MVDATDAVESYLASNCGPTPADPNAREPVAYGVSAQLDGAVLDAVLTFRAGKAYCCGEWGCHLGLFPGRRWEQLRRALAAGGADVPVRLELRLEVVTEPGALFYVPGPSSRAPRVLATATSHRYQVAVTEAAEPPAERPTSPDRGGVR